MFLGLAYVALGGHVSSTSLGWGAVGATAFCLTIIGMGWIFWGAYVRIDDQGISWKEGPSQGRLRWEEVHALGSVANRSRLDVGVIETRTKRLHVLPLISRELYEILKSRMGGLPKNEEGELYNRWSR